MKTTFRILITLLIAMLPTTLFSCHNEEEVETSAIVGTWRYTEEFEDGRIYYDQYTYLKSGEGSWEEGFIVNGSAKSKDWASFEYIFDEKNNRLVITYDWDGGSDTERYKVEYMTTTEMTLCLESGKKLKYKKQ